MDYIELWFSTLALRSRYTPFGKTIDAWGEYNKVTSPTRRYARVCLSIGPNETLLVADSLSPVKAQRLRQERWYEQIVFGVLDVLLTSLSAPVNTFRLTIIDVEYDDIHSVPIAFRLAAREAARNILRELEMYE